MKIVIGLSGGVDSSVAAYLLKKAGHEVIGCTMRTFDTERSLRELEDARKIAEKLDIPFIVMDRRKEFEEDVIRYFVSEYVHGRTPNPCCICNRRVKWQTLLDCMKEQRADKVATGHYSGIGELCGRYYIKKADKLDKDQSYALYNLTQEEISHTIMPLSGYNKDEVRAIAEEAGLFNSDKPDSQEICFIPDKDYAGFIERHKELLPEDILVSSTDKGEDAVDKETLKWNEPGNFVDIHGKILGQHKGIINYTVGQRKGLGIALGKRIFVREIRPLSNEVVLSDNDEVFSDRLVCEDVNFQAVDFESISAIDADAELKAIVKIRYADKGTRAVIRRAEETGRYIVSFEQPVRAVTPGQAAVFYDEEDRLLGGGLIV